ncbi:MAG: type II toxin-antitoxin system RelE/ParE family toxin [Fimbriiglobus sp.]
MAARGPEAAGRWREDVLTAVVTRLKSDPRWYPPADEGPDVGLDIRELVHGTGRHIYRVLFTVDPTAGLVHVHRVRHAAQADLPPGEI